MPTGSGTTVTGTVTVTGLDTTPDSSSYDTAANNTCASLQDIKYPGNLDTTLAEFEFSGRTLEDSVGSGTLTVVTENKPKESFNGGGPYYKKNIEITEVVEGLAIDPGLPAVNQVRPKKEAAYYSLANNRFGIVGANEFLLNDSAPSSTATYSPVFYDRVFALAAGQSMLQSNTRTVSQAGGVTETVVTTERISFTATESVSVRDKPYVVCKYEVRSLAPQNNRVTTQWYLKGTGVLFKSSTATADGPVLRTVNLVRYSRNGVTSFPQ